MYASIIAAHRIVRAVLNKNQYGMVLSSDFNAMAEYAQTIVFRKLASLIKNKLVYRMQGLEEDFGLLGGKEDILSQLEHLLTTQTYLVPPSGQVTITQPYANIKSIIHNQTGIEVSLMDLSDQWAYRRSIAGSGTRNPMAYISTPASSAQTVLYTNLNTGTLWVEYYRIPRSRNPLTGVLIDAPPVVMFTNVNNVENYNPSQSRDFDMKEAILPYIVKEILTLAGLNMRDYNIRQIMEREDIKVNEAQ